jgi:cytochrome c biogenesis protein CcdA
MTASFVMMFGLAGLVATIAASAGASALPWLGTTVGVGLIGLAGLLAAGRTITFPLATSALRRLRPATSKLGLSGYLAYGFAYGLASLGCTLPVFIGVVGTSLQLHGLADAVGQFLLFGLGMGSIVTASDACHGMVRRRARQACPRRRAPYRLGQRGHALAGRRLRRLLLAHDCQAPVAAPARYAKRCVLRRTVPPR